MGAFAGIQGHLNLHLLGFGIGAPLASQRAAFQEYRGADSGAVMYGIALDIENGSSGLHSAPP